MELNFKILINNIARVVILGAISLALSFVTFWIAYLVTTKQFSYVCKEGFDSWCGAGIMVIIAISCFLFFWPLIFMIWGKAEKYVLIAIGLTYVLTHFWDFGREFNILFVSTALTGLILGFIFSRNRRLSVDNKSIK